MLCGRDDQVAPLALSEETAAALPGARLVVLPDCGHMATLEQPQAVVAAMAEWLARVDAVNTLP